MLEQLSKATSLTSLDLTFNVDVDLGGMYGNASSSPAAFHPLSALTSLRNLYLAGSFSRSGIYRVDEHLSLLSPLTSLTYLHLACVSTRGGGGLVHV